MIDSHDLLEQDRKSLHKLALKRCETLEGERQSQSCQAKWAQEYLRWKQDREALELLWHRELIEKRRKDNKHNEKRLLEAREKLLAVQIQLKILIEKKAQKSEEMAQKAQIVRAEKNLEWRFREDTRRLAVESALNELLARDTQYRKELKAHIENRLQLAQKRKMILRQRSLEVLKSST